LFGLVAALRWVNYTGLFHLTFFTCRYRDVIYNQNLAVNFHINSIIFGHLAANYEEKHLIKKAPDNLEAK